MTFVEWLAGEIDERTQKYAGGLLGPTFHGSLKARPGLPPYDKPAKPEADDRIGPDDLRSLADDLERRFGLRYALHAALLRSAADRLDGEDD